MRQDGRLPLPPGPRGHPLLGVVPELRRDPIGTFAAPWRAYGDVVRVPLGGPFSGVLVVHPEAAKHVLHDRHRDYGTIWWYNAQLATLTGEGLL